eukprot:2150590-Rhodomonas_salina.3
MACVRPDLCTCLPAQVKPAISLRVCSAASGTDMRCISYRCLVSAWLLRICCAMSGTDVA